jgi:hypothetical protein
MLAQYAQIKYFYKYLTLQKNIMYICTRTYYKKP